MRIPFPTTVTIVRNGPHDHFGDPTSQEEIVSEGWAIFPATPTTSPASKGRETETFQQDLVAEERLALAPPGTDVRPADMILVDGTLYRILGMPITLFSPISGRNPGIEVMLKATTG